jgi:hypothetical protein
MQRPFPYLVIAFTVMAAAKHIIVLFIVVTLSRAATGGYPLGQ